MSVESPAVSLMSPIRSVSPRAVGAGRAAVEDLRRSHQVQHSVQRGRAGPLSESIMIELSRTEGNVEPYVHPTMPKGKRIQLVMHANWGHPSEVGLAGLDLFDGLGYSLLRGPNAGLCRISTDGRVSALGIEYSDVQALVRGSSSTHDERLMYCVPFEPRNPHIVIIEFNAPTTISVLRIFNYNGRGRADTNKGVRVMEMIVDDARVFFGEVARATGELVGGIDIGILNCENILFTEDPQVLTTLVHQSQVEAGPPRAVTPPPRAKSLLFTRPVVGHRRCATPSDAVCGVHALCIEVYSSWGDPEFVAITGLRLYDAAGMRLTTINRVTVERPSARTHPADDAVTWVTQDGGPTELPRWPLEPRTQIRVLLQSAANLGVIEIANAVAPTESGVRLVHLFASTGPDTDVFSNLWAVAADEVPCEGQLRRLSPVGGVTLRKSPTLVRTPPFQSFDLSLGVDAHCASSWAVSLTASTAVRARVELRRARMALQSPPEWLESRQSYICPLLPIAYVFKVALHVLDEHATRVIDSLVGKPEEVVVLVDDEGHRSDWSQAAVVLSKAYDDVTQSVATVTAVLDVPLALSAAVLRPLLPKALVLRVRLLADDVIIFDSSDITCAPDAIYCTFDERVLKHVQDALGDTS